MKTARFRSFGAESFSASCVMVWMASGMCCRVGRMASAGRCACLYRFAPPLPLGAGEYVRPAGIVSVCGEGVGVSSRFSLSRGPSSCHLVVSVILSPRSACFAAPVVIALVPHVCRSLSSPPHVLRSRLSAPCAFVLVPLCSRVVSYRLSPRSFDEPGGAFFTCLLALFVAALVPSSRFPHSLRSSS